MKRAIVVLPSALVVLVAMGKCCASSHDPPDTACQGYEEGANGRCVYCDHEKRCHPGPGATCEIGRDVPRQEPPPLPPVYEINLPEPVEPEKYDPEPPFHGAQGRGARRARNRNAKRRKRSN